MSRTLSADPRAVRSERAATRDTCGINSLSSSSRFADNSLDIDVIPVTFPPGRAKLAASPSSTGSGPVAVTMGIELVTCFAASEAGLPAVTNMSTLAATSSVAKPWSRLTCPFPHRG